MHQSMGLSPSGKVSSLLFLKIEDKLESDSQWVLTKCSIFGNCKVNDIYDPKVYILGSHNQLKMNFYHCKHFHKSRFTFFGNLAYVILESVNFKMIFHPSSGLGWLSGWILSEKLVFWRSVGLTVQFLDHILQIPALSPNFCHFLVLQNV